MNNQRMKQIRNIIRELEIYKSRLENIISNEQFTFDNIPENLQASLNGIRSEEDIDYMDDANDFLNDAIDLLNQAADKIDEAIDSLQNVY